MPLARFITPSRAAIVIGALLAIPLACSLIVNTDADQCTTDGDCTRYGAGRVCGDDHVCHSSTPGGDSGLPLGDGGCEQSIDGSVCYACAPTTNEQLINACDKNSCEPFNNFSRLTDFDGGLPGLVQPPPDDTGVASGDTGTTPTDTGVDTGPALPACDSLPGPVYLLGSTALQLVFRTYAQAIASTGTTLVYDAEASCLGLDAILTGTTRMSAVATYWVPGDNNDHLCTTNAGQVADIGLCDIFPDTCSPGTIAPNFLGDFTGPVQIFMFTVPHGSSQTTISAEAAYEVFGIGASANVTPWNDESHLYRRHPASGNQLVISSFINVPPDGWHGVRVESADSIKPLMLADPDPEKVLAITSGDVADDPDSRNKLRTLAYQHYGQTCGYTPDSTLGSYDKANVRDGHYFMFAPEHFYVRLDATSHLPASAKVNDVLNYLTGAQQLPDKNTDVITSLKQGGLVPRCAMKVDRSKEGGPLVPFTPKPSCGCAFDAASPSSGLDPACKACANDSDCPSARPSCNFGYCEVQ